MTSIVMLQHSVTGHGTPEPGPTFEYFDDECCSYCFSCVENVSYSK